MKRILRVLAAVCVWIPLSTCEPVFENPVDSGGTKYQGYPTVQGVTGVVPFSPADGATLVWPVLVCAKSPDADLYQVQVAATAAGLETATAVEAIPGLTIREEDETELLRGSEWFEKMESEVTPGRMLRVYRYNAGLTLASLGGKAGIPVPHLSGMEHDKRPIGKLNARRLAAALNCDYRRFL